VFGEFGGNDYSFAWKADWSLEKVKEMVPDVVSSMIRGIERILDEGARHVLVPGNIPAGCIPITLTMYPSDDRSQYDPRTGCLKKYNNVALYHNAMLRVALDRLQRRRPESRIIYGDYYTPYIQFARTPHLYGQYLATVLPLSLSKYIYISVIYQRKKRIYKPVFLKQSKAQH
jgi:hypothetical protein